MTKAMLLLALLVPTLGTAVERQARSVVLSRAPERPAAGASYLFYLHGRIVEDQGADAVSPDYGRYEYSGIVQGLADEGWGRPWRGPKVAAERGSVEAQGVSPAP